MAQRLLLRSGGLIGRYKNLYSPLCSLCLQRGCTRNNTNKVSLYQVSSSNSRVRWIGSSTRVLQQEEKKQQKQKAKPPPPPDSNDDDSDDDDDDECPRWQNPLHHNNPDYQPEKVFEEDFEPGEEIPKIPLPPFGDGTDKVIADPHLHELAEDIVNLTMLEMKDLVDKIDDYFGFSDEDDAMVYGGEGEQPQEGGDAAPAQEEKTAFDLKLTGFDAKAKIKVIKEVRAIAGLGLKEAKELVEGAPKVVKKDIKQEEAEELKKKLEEVGATVEIA